MGASQVGEDRVRTTKRRERASIAFGLCGENGQETPSAFIDNEIDLLWHEEKILKPKTPGCLEHKFCETNGYPVGNGTMEKTKIEHPQEAKWFTYWIRFYFGIGVWIVHTNLLL